MLVQTLGTNFSGILSAIYIFSFKKTHLKMSSAKWRYFCLDLNVLPYNDLNKNGRRFACNIGFSKIFLDRQTITWITIDQYLWRQLAPTAQGRMSSKNMVESLCLCVVCQIWYTVNMALQVPWKKIRATALLEYCMVSWPYWNNIYMYVEIEMSLLSPNTCAPLSINVHGRFTVCDIIQHISHLKNSIPFVHWYTP